MKANWNKAPQRLTDFNGLILEMKLPDGRDLGIFREKYRKGTWTCRTRRINDSWGAGVHVKTKREAMALADRFLEIF